MMDYDVNLVDLDGLDLKKVPLQIKSFVVNLAEVWTEDADQS